MILIVEDDPQVARLISLVLERQGHEAEIISDGASALKSASERRPVMVFADLNLNGMNGDLLCRTMKGDESTAGIPVILLSGDRDLPDRAALCGADGYLGKPFEFNDLIRLVKTHTDDRKS